MARQARVRFLADRILPVTAAQHGWRHLLGGEREWYVGVSSSATNDVNGWGK